MDLVQTSAAIECTASNGGHVVGNIHSGQIGAAIESTASNGMQGIVKYHLGQTGATNECIVADGFNGDRNVHYRVLIIIKIEPMGVEEGVGILRFESYRTPSRQVGDIDSCQACAIFECKVRDGSNRIVESHRG